MKEVYRAKDVIEAHIVVGMLASHDIDSFVSGYYLQGGVGELASYDFARVWVAEDDLNKAIPIIRNYDNKTEAAPSCRTEPLAHTI